jgi:quercetin dioxygenase-like cupin family protein
VLAGILISTEHLTVGRIELLPGQHTAILTHGGDKSLYVTEGTLNVRLNDQPAPSWFELEPRDGFYLPEGTPHQLYNITDRPVQVVFGVAPTYLPEGSK